MKTAAQIKRILCAEIAARIAITFHEHFGEFPETDVYAFIDSMVPVIKRDAQNDLYEVAEDEKRLYEN